MNWDGNGSLFCTMSLILEEFKDESTIFAHCATKLCLLKYLGKVEESEVYSITMKFNSEV